MCVCVCVCVFVSVRERGELRTLLLKTEILGNSLFLQSVLAKLHGQHIRLLMTLSKLTQYYETVADNNTTDNRHNQLTECHRQFNLTETCYPH